MFGGLVSPHSIQTWQSMFGAEDFLESRRFTILSKIVLQLPQEEGRPQQLQEQLELSTGLINETDAEGILRRPKPTTSSVLCDVEQPNSAQQMTLLVYSSGASSFTIRQQREMSDDLTFCGKGYYSTVYRINGTDRVVKCFEGASAAAQCDVETKVYERFTSVSETPPPGILKCYGPHPTIPNSILLEHAVQDNLWEWLWRAREFGQSPDPTVLYRWARQAAEAFAFAHHYGVLHSDIHVINFLLDADSNLKVADWAGASIDGGHSLSRYRRDHTLPGTAHNNISVASEIFAFGMALYNMITIEEPYPGLHHERDKDELKRRLAEKEFPDTTKLIVLGQAIRGCWNLQYKSMEEVLESLIDESNGS
ncbi:hypothetical protein LTR10_024359 [Elasticomyces elasticus]|uniref:Protein kinase domain-containing protein n=1 Tax=Exophiala sideris TaxID=1016849 RepID=A0ABR0JFD3_9EURO|nr:hypothetical protein LTR10_024359 [Elasticomyces elasticus]KAK5025339.1 hypothetical protein LTS07_008190 [Exophiala sideris]KAK5029114.1 hypothetical protein LTR13_008651 [Exophiala sideris]KAK5063399.1 hypothetical protein LTR69_004105 [Exophiala sideris]KAK5179114.1 hypothetical protein LTR44_008603 [Eurotiomycetes sp. CCFEE 6388]